MPQLLILPSFFLSNSHYIPNSMAPEKILIVFYLLQVLVWNISALTNVYPFTCLANINSCNALLYQHNGLQIDQIASLYSVNGSNVKSIVYSTREDYLVPVNCSCQNVNGTNGYFYDVVYEANLNDSFYDVSNQKFSGQVWDQGQDTNLTAGVNKTLHLLCGCVDNDSQVVVTYTVQAHDTLSSLSSLLTAREDGILKMNTYLASNPSYIDIGWLLYVPMEKFGFPPSKRGN